MNSNFVKIIGVLFVLGCFPFLHAQTSKDTTALSEVVLLGTPLRNQVQSVAVAVAVVSAKEINANDGSILTPILNKIPGVYMQQGALNTNKITIRGIGARSQFSTNRIKAYFENIPLTSAEGETTLEDIDLEVLGRIEIIKGPNATHFGAGLGGVIHLFANQNKQAASFGSWSSTVGSFGLMKNSFTGQFNTEKSSLLLNYSNLQSDGFRNNSAYDRQSVNLFGKHSLSAKGTLNFVSIATRVKAFIPSSLNENDFLNQPEVAAANWAAAQGFESYDKLLLGIGYNHQFSKQWTLETSVFGNFKKAFEPRPFDILDDQNTGIGWRSNLKWEHQIGNLPTKINLGTEGMTENYDFSLFENLFQTQPGQGSVLGEKFSEASQKRSYWNWFLQFEMQLTSQLHLESGLSINRTQFSQNELFEPENLTANSYQFPIIASPRIALSYQISKGKNIYTSVSKGFSTPSLAETLTPDGQLNTAILPEVGINFEMGFKGSFLNKKLYTELVFYRTKISDLLVARRIAEDQFLGLNAGESLHQGVEFLVQYDWILNEKVRINPYFSGSWNRFEFIDFLDMDTDYSGKKLPSTPDAQWNVGISVNTKSGFSLTTNYGKTGQMFLNDANIFSTEAYQLLDLKASYSFPIFKKFLMQMNFGIQNVLDEKYAASILPNAVGFSNAPPRYFYPGNPRNNYGGLKLTYDF
ncbi:MAG: TonB-dependent receptor [Flavobacterium sp.]